MANAPSPSRRGCSLPSICRSASAPTSGVLGKITALHTNPLDQALAGPHVIWGGATDKFRGVPTCGARHPRPRQVEPDRTYHEGCEQKDLRFRETALSILVPEYPGVGNVITRVVDDEDERR